MKRKILILPIVIAFLLAGCSQIMSVIVQFVNIDSEEKSLQLHFEFLSTYNNEKKSLDCIEIFRNDSLIVRLENQNYEIDNIYSWDFPSIPQGFKITYPDSLNSLPLFNKNNRLRFEFLADGAYDTWIYKPEYAEEYSRFLFDKNGNQIVSTEIYYEPRIGKDLIIVKLNQEYQIKNEKIKLQTINGSNVNYTLKTFKNPTDKFALIIESKTKSKDTLLFELNLGVKKIINEKLIIPNKMEPTMSLNKFSEIK